MSASASSRTARPVTPTAAPPEEVPSVTHELANLVQAVGGNLELVAARTTDQQSLRYLGNARAAVEQLKELTRKLREEAG